MQCQQLEAARQRGQLKWMEDQGMADHLSKMCAEMKDKNPQDVVRTAKDAQAKLLLHAKDQVSAMKQQVHQAGPTSLAGKSLAMGCTALLKAKNNGKMEWFESQEWYKRAMQMCTSLSGTSPMELEDRMKKKQGELAHRFGAIQGSSPLELLKLTCTQLSKTPREHPVRSADFFPQAEHMCATVQTSSPQELRELIGRQQHKAETASGQLVKQTCEKLGHDQRMGLTKQFEHEPWLAAMQKMCMKMGTRKVSGKGLMQRCQWYEKMKKMGKEKIFQKQVWYNRLESACKWLEQKKGGKGVPEQHALGEQGSVTYV
jgi:hypothetical protein